MPTNNIMTRSEQLQSLRDVFLSELVCTPEHLISHDQLVAIGCSIVIEYTFDTISITDLNHEATMALYEFSDIKRGLDCMAEEGLSDETYGVSDLCCELRVLGL